MSPAQAREQVDHDAHASVRLDLTGSSMKLLVLGPPGLMVLPDGVRRGAAEQGRPRVRAVRELWAVGHRGRIRRGRAADSDLDDGLLAAIAEDDDVSGDERG